MAQIFSCGSSLSLEVNLTSSKSVTLIFSIYTIWVGNWKTELFNLWTNGKHCWVANVAPDTIQQESFLYTCSRCWRRVWGFLSFRLWRQAWIAQNSQGCSFAISCITNLKVKKKNKSICNRINYIIQSWFFFKFLVVAHMLCWLHSFHDQKLALCL